MILTCEQNSFFTLLLNAIGKNSIPSHQSVLCVGYCLQKLHFLFFSATRILYFEFIHTPVAPVLLNLVWTGKI